MYYLDRTPVHTGTPTIHLALDQALLEMCEGGFDGEVLRIWESQQPFVVLGYGSRSAEEVNIVAAQRHGIPVLRRVSGGATVLQGPGCLSYAMVLRTTNAACATVTSANMHVMQRNRAALQTLTAEEVRLSGVTDLSISSCKFSGNSQRRLKHYLLFHGTVLYNFDLELIEALLPLPPRHPDYRASRSHRLFLTNFPATRHHIAQALRAAWGAHDQLPQTPFDLALKLEEERYSRYEWTFRL